MATYEAVNYVTHEAYTLQQNNARLQRLGTWFLLKDKHGSEFVGFTKKIYDDPEAVIEVSADDLEEELPPRDWFVAPDNISQVPDDLYDDNVFWKGEVKNEDGEDDDDEDDAKSNPDNVLACVGVHQKRLHEAIV